MASYRVVCSWVVCSRRLLIAILIGWPLAGCSDNGGRFTIAGSATYDGQPITNGNIGFISTESDNGKSVGTEIVDGHYEIPGYEGPVQGSYKVVIYAERPSGRKLQADEGSSEMLDQLEQYIPWIYNDRSTLTAEISGDRDDLDFNLEKPKRTKRGGSRR